jgi:uncharacterized protein (TIGR02145 family)
MKTFTLTCAMILLSCFGSLAQSGMTIQSGGTVTVNGDLVINTYFPPVGNGMVPATLEEILSIPSIETLDTSLIPAFLYAKKLPFSLDVPLPGFQGSYQSCVSWAVGYGMLGYAFKHIEGHNDYQGNDRIFSPNFIWNQLNDGIDKGIKITSAISLVKSQGCCKLTDMPLTNPSEQPSVNARLHAANFKLTDSYRFPTKDIEEMKVYLSLGYPIIIGLSVDQAFLPDGESQFEKQTDGRLVWKRYTNNIAGQHAMLICGYDDGINAFKVLNSLGPTWGNNGYFWMDYEFFKIAVQTLASNGIFYPEIYVGFVKRPYLTTNLISNITQNTAQSGGFITSDWGYGVTDRGVCWSTFPDPTILDSKTSDGTGTGGFLSTLTGLSASTKYYIKAYASNSQGISYGTEKSFTTTASSVGQPCPGMPTFTDTRDGNVYGTVQIGTQCWMAQNLNIGTKVLRNTNQTNNSIIEKYCYYNNENNCNTYGGLYQWNEAMQYVTTEGVKGICSTGWHLPTDAEWTTLTTYLGGLSIAGGKLKEAGLTHWLSPNTGATNSSGFTALPGGYTYTDNSFVNLTHNAYFWSSSQGAYPWGRDLSCNLGSMSMHYYNLTDGLSVRCLKD